MWQHIIWVGLLMALVSLGVGFWAWSSGNQAWQTMIFTTLALLQLGNALAIRSERQSFFTLGPNSNRPPPRQQQPNRQNHERTGMD